MLFNSTRLKLLFKTREEDRGETLLANASLAAANEMSLGAAVMQLDACLPKPLISLLKMSSFK